MKLKVGLGVDVHQFANDKELCIGGIKIDFERGLLGHSDADVLIHAICDAMLGAAHLRDIGYHFPDSDEQYKGIDSKILLKQTVNLIRDKGFEVENVDATICAQRPKLNKYIPQMQQVLSEIIGIDEEDVSVKATTTEKLGFVGREEGIEAYAVTLLKKM